jgi:hypothetical protein
VQSCRCWPLGAEHGKQADFCQQPGGHGSQLCHNVSHIKMTSGQSSPFQISQAQITSKGVVSSLTSPHNSCCYAIPVLQICYSTYVWTEAVLKVHSRHPCGVPCWCRSNGRASLNLSFAVQIQRRRGQWEHAGSRPICGQLGVTVPATEPHECGD